MKTVLTGGSARRVKSKNRSVILPQANGSVLRGRRAIRGSARVAWGINLRTCGNVLVVMVSNARLMNSVNG